MYYRADSDQTDASKRTMTSTDLIDGRYDAFLLFCGFNAIRHVIDTQSFRTSGRTKGLAVRNDGKVFRMQLKSEGYQDKFVERDGAAVLIYVCGNPEERRRQHLNRAGDQVTVVLDRKSDDAHAILRGTFLHIVAHHETKPDGTELLVPHSYIRIDAFTQPDGPDVDLKDSISDDAPSKRARGPEAEAEHLFLDTESAAPFDQRLMGHRHDPFPILQHACVRTDASFVKLANGCECVRYPDELSDALGNDAQSSVLKFGVKKLRAGREVHLVLERIYDEIARVVSKGGCLFAHNVVHDLRQIEKTAKLVGHVAGASRRAHDRHCQGGPQLRAGGHGCALDAAGGARGRERVPAPTEAYHDAETDTRTLEHRSDPLPRRRLDAYVERRSLEMISPRGV